MHDYSLTLVNCPSCTSEFFEPAYIICCSGLHPEEEEEDVMVVSGGGDVYLLTLRANEYEAERIGDPAIIMFVAVAVRHIAWLVSWQ